MLIGKLGELLELLEFSATWLFAYNMTVRFQCFPNGGGSIDAFHRHDRERGVDICQHLLGA